MKKISYLLIILIAFFAFGMTSKALSASISTSSNTIYVGDTIKVYVKIYDAAAWTIYFKPSGATNCKALAYADTSDDAQNTNKTYTMTCSGVKAGSATFAIVSPSNITNESGYTKNVTYTKTITVKTKVVVYTAKSTNNYLSSLGIDGAELDPIFNKDTDTYNVILKPNTTNIKISASLQDAKAKVKGTGTVAVTDGLNVLKIVVTAENGKTRTYTINATVTELDPIEVTLDDIIYTVVRKQKDLPLASTNYTYSTIKIDGEEVPCLYSKISDTYLVGLRDSEGVIQLYRYAKEQYIKYNEFEFTKTVLSIREPEEIPTGYKLSSIIIDGVDIPCYKIDNVEYVLLYGTNETTGNTGFYTYDKVENSIQRYIYHGKNYYTKIVAGLLVIIMIISMVAAIEGTITKMRNNKTKKADTNKDKEEFKEKVEAAITKPEPVKKEKIKNKDVNKIDL